MGKGYLFPYEKIGAHSKVVVYAFGKVGVCYADQLRANRYCELTAIVDRNYRRKSCRDFPVYGLDYLRQNDEYDYVVIALQDELTRNQVFEELIGLGVERRKIVDVAPLEVIDKYPEPLRPDLSNLLDIVRGVELNAEFCFEYYIDVINDVIILHKDSPLLLDTFKARLPECKVPEEKMVLLQIFYAAGVFDTALMCQYLHTIMELDDVEWKYHFFRFSTHMVFFKPECLYDDYYLDRRGVMKAISDELGLHVLPKASRRNTNGRKKRIAILALCLVDNRTGAHFFAVTYANMMQAHGYEVAVFSDEKSCDLVYAPCRCGKDALVPTLYTVNAARYNSQHERNYYPDVRLVYTDSVSRSVCAQRTAKRLEEFDPDGIIDISDDLSVLSAAFYGRCPIFQISLRGYASSSYFDKFLARDREPCLETNRKYRAVQESQMHFHDVLFPVWPIGTAYRRADYGLAESDFILTTVGNRLATEMTQGFIASFAALLRAHPDMRWILVGESLPGCLNDMCGDLLDDKRILKWGYENDLTAFYQMCDVFVNPDRQGSGGAISMAVFCGVPVATTSRIMSDAWSFIGQFATAGDYTELAGYVMKLKEDKLFYRSVSERGVQTIQKIFDEQDEDFISAVEELISHWHTERILEH